MVEGVIPATMRGLLGCTRSPSLTVPMSQLSVLARHVLQHATSTCTSCRQSSSAYVTRVLLVQFWFFCLAGQTSQPFTTCCAPAPAHVAIPHCLSPCTPCCP